MGETANITKLPPFGDLLNSGIQTLKNLSGRSSISQNLFFREFDKVSQLSDDQKSISYLSQFDIQNEYEEGTPCYEPLTNLILMCLSAMVSDGNVKVTPDMILAQLDNLTPLQFEWFCVKLVERSLENENPESNLSSHHTGKANDGGIDGMITQIFSNEERHTYYIQAKLYSQGNNISNRELRNFVGGYPPQKDSHHGIFITTTSFTKPALDYFENLESHSLILIDQMALIELMMEHEVGLKQVDSKPKLVLDNDFFEKIKRY